MDLHNDDIDLFCKLEQQSRENQKSPEQAYLDKFGIKRASDLVGMQFDPFTFLYEGLVPSIGLGDYLLCITLRRAVTWLQRH